MKTRMTAGLALIGAAAFAQGAPATDNPNAVVLSQGKTIAQAAADWARAANVTVVVDPTLTGTVSAATARLPMEAGLAAIAKAEHAEWRKAYLRASDIPKTADGAVDFNKLRVIVESAASVPGVAVGVLDQATGMIAMSTRVPANAASTREWLKDRPAIWILYRPAIVGSAVGRTGGDSVSDYLATQRNAMEAYRAMTPEQRAEASRQALDMVLNMDPAMMGQMARESMQALQSLSPDQKAKLMDLSVQMMSSATTPGQ